LREYDSNLVDYLPGILKEKFSFRLMMNAEDPEFRLLWQQADKVLGNLFIRTCDLSTLLRLERMFGIVSDPSVEADDFRRERLILRLNRQPPYTVNYLRRRLNEIIGSGNWDMDIDHADKTFLLTVALYDLAWHAETEKLLESILPANMVYTIIIALITECKLYIGAWYAEKRIEAYRVI